MSRTLKILFIIFFICTALLVYPTLVNAADKQIATSNINGIDVAWEYYLNDAGQITNLVCTNASFLSGSVTIPSTLRGKTVISLGSNAFSGASNITEITIPDSVKEIDYKAFKDCSKLTNVDLGSITSISFEVFEGCSSLTQLTIPKTLKQGSVSPCLNNPNITKITFEDGLTIIPSYLCANTSITEITIPDSVKEIDYKAFKDCSKLTKVTILENVKDFSFDLFTNHNENLTFYCYQDSYAAKYAIENNIKVSYLQKQNSDTSIKDENNSETTKKEDIKKDDIKPKTDSEENKITATKTDSKEDKTTASGILPNTGVNLRIIVFIILGLIIGLFAYKKYNILKDVT